MIVVFSGIDGCGKTTYAKAATHYLIAKGTAARYMHISRDSFYHFLLNNFIGKFSKSSQTSLEKGLRNKENKTYFLLTGTLKKILLFIDILIFNIRYSHYKNNKKQTLICDRYFYDNIVQMEYLSIAGHSFISLYRKLIAAPDIIFLLHADPAVAYLRKPEYEKEYFFQKQELYSSFYSTLSHIDIHDAGIPENTDCICRHITKAL